MDFTVQYNTQIIFNDMIFCTGYWKKMLLNCPIADQAGMEMHVA